MAQKIKLPHTFRLSTPLIWGKDQPAITEVVIDKEPSAGDLVEIMNEEKKGDQFLRMVATATGWEDPKVKALSAADLLGIGNVVQAFLPAGPGTGRSA